MSESSSVEEYSRQENCREVDERRKWKCGHISIFCARPTEQKDSFLLLLLCRIICFYSFSFSFLCRLSRCFLCSFIITNDDCIFVSLCMRKIMMTCDEHKVFFFYFIGMMAHGFSESRKNRKPPNVKR